MTAGKKEVFYELAFWLEGRGFVVEVEGPGDICS